MMDGVQLFNEHMQLFEQYERVIDAENINPPAGCTCPPRRAIMTNAGTAGMSLDWEYIYPFEYCKLTDWDHSPAGRAAYRERVRQNPWPS